MKKVIVFVYLVIIHSMFLLLLSKTHLIEKLKNHLQNDSLDNPKIAENLIVFQQRIDAQISENQSLFLGDSHIQGLNVTNILHNSINFGIGGDTTTSLIDRLNLYNSLHIPSRIIVLIGVNDLLNDIVPNFRELIHELEQSTNDDATIYFVEIPFVAKQYNNSNKLNKKIARFNDQLKNITLEKSHPKSFYIHNSLNDYEGHLRDSFYLGDNIHLNSRGNFLLANAIIAVIQESHARLNKKRGQEK